MLFSSINFIFYFLPVVLLLYFALPFKFKNYLLLAASIFFYGWGEPVYVVLMLFSAFFNYTMAKQIDAAQRNYKKTDPNGKYTLAFTVFVNLLVLGFYKYFAFLLDIINSTLGTDIQYSPLPLPIGISFYTFQGLSYVIDLYRKNVAVQKSYINFALYLSLFPQLIAGPIVKYKDVADALSNRHTTLEDFGNGAERFILGLGKKVLLANVFGSIHTQVLGMDKATMVMYWLGAVAYTLQIYFDFSGYSDMAIGLGKILGFDFLENFNYPYISKSVTEFWRRWHISLSTWFKEYLYIPLGGNRVSAKRHILNLMIVWSLTGLWHGAGLNFIAWGTYYGILLIIEKYLIGDYLNSIKDSVRHIITLLIVMIGWVFFFSDNLTDAFIYLGHLIGIGTSGIISVSTLYILKNNMIILVLGLIGSTPVVMKNFRLLKKYLPPVYNVILFLIFMFSVASLVYSTYNPFLYFRF